MNTVLVDSDIIIELLRNRNAEVRDRWHTLRDGDATVAYSPVTAAEIWQGARDPEESAIDALFSSIVCVPTDDVIGKRAGEYLRRYYRSHAMELGDAVIAATASIHDLLLWTRNKKHYPMRDVRLY